ncbi:MAG: hypothetical protein HY704_15290 [Gemmatimonadetes bacterium]|nr:hypothetical protein [Gemmatimonadota bacterium]
MVLGRLADYAAAERSAHLPAEVLHHAMRAVVDWFAATIPGGTRPPATLLREALGEELGGRGSRRARLQWVRA